jgi:hypothetical protein
MKNVIFWEIMPCADVSEKRIASIITVTRIGELETKLEVTSNRRTLRRNTMVLWCFAW